MNGSIIGHSLLRDYGIITLASINADIVSYANTQTKTAQDFFMAFQCIFASLKMNFVQTVTT
jgi:hypothetical protein